MCGIAGLVGSGADEHVDRVEAMVAALDHRGPDDRGIAVFDGAVLGSSRLSIIDPAGGHQPLRGPDLGTALVCNGEIYGHRRLRERFGSYPFRSGSDCEVVLPLYEQYGADLLHHLPGTFSLALWDDRRGALLLARDRFGERPLYYATTPDGMLAFASESRALLASGLVEHRPDPEMVAQVLRQGYVPSGRSVWSGVRSLPHASRLVWTAGTEPTVDRWWTPPEVGWDLSEDEAAEWFRGELDRAVQDQLESDVPIGAFLSGGVDSTTIAALAARHHGDLHAFAYEMPGAPETEFARATAERHGITLHVVHADTTDVASQILELASTWDEPFGDSSALPTSQLCRFARERVKTVLTGDGADELLGGYLVWARDCLVAASDDGPSAARPARQPRRFLDVMRRGRGRRPGTPGGRDAPTSPGSDVARRYSTFRQYFDAAELASFGLPAVDATSVDLSGYLYDSVDDISRFDLDHYLPGDILVKTDRASMAHGLEVRSPFLDVAVAEGCLSLPAHHKVDDTHEKLLLRRAFGSLWPDTVRTRTKQGFGAPMAEWLALPDVAELKRSHLTDPASALFDLVDHDAVQPFVDADDQRTWNLLMVSVWWTRCRSEMTAR
jgi:asparagine synthase (glutamine-hydrolysing)